MVVGSARRGTLPSDAFEALDGGADSVVLVEVSGLGVGDGGVWSVSPTDPAELGKAESCGCCCDVGDGTGAGTSVDAGVDTGVLKGTTIKDAIVEAVDVDGPGAKTGAAELAAGVEKGI